MVRFDCPHCGRQLNLKDSAAGRRGPCPGCKAIIVVPHAGGSGAGDADPLETAGDAANEAPVRRWMVPAAVAIIVLAMAAGGALVAALGLGRSDTARQHQGAADAPAASVQRN